MMRKIGSTGSLAKVLQGADETERNEPMDAVVRRFWSRTKERTANAAGANVVDLAEWVRRRGEPAR